MFYHDGKLQYPVKVETPSPVFAKMLQQALGGIEGEMRIFLQYLFQAWNYRGPKKYRNVLMEIGTEEIAHAEMLATAIAMNLEGADGATKEKVAKNNPMVEAVMGGMAPRSFLSAGMGAMATDSQGVPFNGSWIVASGNFAADLYANIEAESTGRTLVTRLHGMTDDPGMKDMLGFLAARDTMHQQQWLAILEELGGYEGTLPIPNSFPQENEPKEFSYAFLTTHKDGETAHAKPDGRFTSGPSLDGRGEFSRRSAEPRGEEPRLAPPNPAAFAETQQMAKGVGGVVDEVIDKVRDVVDE